MRVEAGTPDTVRQVAQRMRDRDFDELSALMGHETKDELADDLAMRLGDAASTIVAFSQDVPVIACGVFLARPNVGTLVMFATPDMSRIGYPFSRFVIQTLLPEYVAAGVHRFEAVSLSGYTDVHRWIESLGLKHEATLRKYGRSGEDFEQFAWVSE